MSKNPILVVTGLAVAAVAGIAGLTKDKWMGEAPQQVASTASSTSAESAAPAAEAPAKQPDQTDPLAAQPAAEKPAEAAAPAAQPAVEQPAAAVAPEAEQPVAVEAPVAEAAPEQEIAAVQPEQSAPAPETKAPAAAPEAVPAAEPSANAGSETVPAFDTVRVEKTGEAVIAGTAEAGSEVAVKLDGETIGTATANGEGAFVVVPDAPLPAGSGALTIESKGKGDEQAVQSEQSVAVIIPAEQKQEALVAIVSPDAPTKVLQKPAPEPEPKVAALEPEAQPETPTAVPAKEPVEQPAAGAAKKPVSIDSVDYDTAGNIVFSGQGQAGNTARVYVDNSHTGDAAIEADGRWSFSATAEIAPGQHSLRVDGIDAAGKVANRVEVPFFREETSKVAASAPAVTSGAAKSDSEAGAGEQPAAQTATVNPEITVAAPLPPKKGRVVIQPGNNLWRISRVLYGSGEKYTMLYQANKDQIRDPDMIFPGQIFTTPEVSPKTDTIDPKRREPLKPEENAASAP